MIKKVFVVGFLKESVQIELPPGPYTNSKTSLVFEIPCVWSDGMIGAFPVFSTREAALNYTGQEHEDLIMVIDVTMPTRN